MKCDHASRVIINLKAKIKPCGRKKSNVNLNTGLVNLNFLFVLGDVVFTLSSAQGLLLAAFTSGH